MSDAIVLIVDDEPEICDLLALGATGAGGGDFSVNILRAPDGAQALTLLSSHNVDVVLSDIVMPSMSGLQLLRRARQEGWGRPFIFISGFGDREAIMTAMKLGAFDFIEKPFEMEAVRKLTKSAIRSSKLQQKLEGEIEDDDLGEKRKAILSVRTYDENFDLDDLKADPKAVDVAELFTKEISSHLNSAMNLVGSLTKGGDQLDDALGAMFRLANSIQSAAELNLYDELRRFVSYLRDLFAYYRIHPEEIDQRAVDLIGESLVAIKEEVHGMEQGQALTEGRGLSAAEPVLKNFYEEKVARYFKDSPADDEPS